MMMIMMMLSRPMFSLPGEAPILKSFPSAFQPPVTRPEPPLFSPGHNLFPGLRSPGSSSRSSPSPITGLKTDENSNTADSRMLLSSPDSGKLGEEDLERSQKREWTLFFFKLDKFGRCFNLSVEW